MDLVWSGEKMAAAVAVAVVVGLSETAAIMLLHLQLPLLLETHQYPVMPSLSPGLLQLPRHPQMDSPRTTAPHWSCQGPTQWQPPAVLSWRS